MKRDFFAVEVMSGLAPASQDEGFFAELINQIA